jgi:hypothetical protein
MMINGFEIVETYFENDVAKGVLCENGKKEKYWGNSKGDRLILQPVNDKTLTYMSDKWEKSRIDRQFETAFQINLGLLKTNEEILYLSVSTGEILKVVKVTNLDQGKTTA